MSMARMNVSFMSFKWVEGYCHKTVTLVRSGAMRTRCVDKPAPAGAPVTAVASGPASAAPTVPAFTVHAHGAAPDDDLRATRKHVPGHGHTTVDSHTGLAVISRTGAEGDRIDPATPGPAPAGALAARGVSATALITEVPTDAQVTDAGTGAAAPVRPRSHVEGHMTERSCENIMRQSPPGQGGSPRSGGPA
jgi:hypothetical protein